MKKRKKQASEMENQFLHDYREITKTPVIKSPEWRKKGDVFHKFSMYNPNYKVVPSLKSIGSTTLVKDL